MLKPDKAKKKNKNDVTHVRGILMHLPDLQFSCQL